MIKRKLLNKCLGMALFLCITFSACGENTEEQENLRQEGIQYIKDGKYEDAIASFDKALAEDDGSYSKLEIDICLYKAKAQIMLGRQDEAIKTYSTMIDYEKDSAAYFARGCMYLEEGNKDLGLADFEAGVKEDQENFELYIGIAQALEKYDMKELATEYLDKALEIDKDTEEVVMHKGRIYMLKGDYSNAQKNLQKALDKGYEKANFYMGQLWAMQGDDNLSETYYKSYIDSGEAEPDELYELGRKQMDAGEYKGALLYFEAAQKSDKPISDSQSLKKNIIICYENLKDFQKAKVLMEEYIKAYPQDEKAQRESLFLETR